MKCLQEYEPCKSNIISTNLSLPLVLLMLQPLKVELLRKMMVMMTSVQTAIKNPKIVMTLINSVQCQYARIIYRLFQLSTHSITMSCTKYFLFFLTSHHFKGKYFRFNFFVVKLSYFYGKMMLKESSSHQNCLTFRTLKKSPSVKRQIHYKLKVHNHFSVLFKSAIIVRNVIY